MKNYILFVFILTIFNMIGYSQSYREAYRADMCDCVTERTQGDYRALQKSYNDCIKELLPEYAPRIDASITEDDPRVKVQKGLLQRTALNINFQIELINTCESYFTMIQNGREEKLRREKFDGATIKKINEDIALYPNYGSYLRRAKALIAKGDYDAAITDLKKSLELQPQYNRDAYHYLGWAYEKKEEYKAAAEAYSQMRFDIKYDQESISLQTIAMHKAGSDIYITSDDFKDNRPFNNSKNTTDAIKPTKDKKANSSSVNLEEAETSSRRSKRGTSTQRIPTTTKKSPSKEKLKKLFEIDGDDGK